MKKIKNLSAILFSAAFVFFHTAVAYAQQYSVPTGTGLPDSGKGIRGILANLLSWLLGVFGMLALISFIVAGILYLTSAGDEKRMQSAKRAASYSILGVVVALSAFVVVQAVDKALNAASF